MTTFANLHTISEKENVILDTKLLKRLSQDSALSSPPAEYRLSLGSLPETDLELESHSALDHINLESSPLNSSEVSTISLDLELEHLSFPSPVLLKGPFQSAQPIVYTKTFPQTDNSYWEDLVNNFSQRYQDAPDLVREKLYDGIPSTYRGRLWKIMSKGDLTFLETLYAQLVNEASPHDWDISLDLPRTFPRLEMFQDKDGPGQTGMRNVLRVYSTYDSQVGYCQGFGHIVGVLLMQLEECEAFCVFVRMMESYNLRTTYLHNMIGLELRIYQLRSLMSAHLPKLLSHLDAYNVKTGMYSTQWFLTLFGCCFPLPLVQRIFDVMFIDGIDVTLLRVALTLLKRNEARILQLNQFEDIMMVLSNRLCEPYVEAIGDIITEAKMLEQTVNKKSLSVYTRRHELLRKIFDRS
ncbi:hypothetical protein K7432_013164 [Basidiobolus ranarum]|uniref:Rab-GAP TBC domain-containing protein n=1 Tax=Basidiobolus ranarum TaxID=34480 RepID=A0ABR2WJQ1_9FUNG